MIDVRNVSMKFNLGIEKEFSIKQAFVNFFSGKNKKHPMMLSDTAFFLF